MFNGLALGLTLIILAFINNKKKAENKKPSSKETHYSNKNSQETFPDSAFDVLRDILLKGIDSNKEMSQEFVKNFFGKKESNKIKKFDNKEYLRRAEEEKRQTKIYYKNLEEKERAYRFDSKNSFKNSHNDKDDNESSSGKFDSHFLDSEFANAMIIKEILDKPLSLR